MFGVKYSFFIMITDKELALLKFIDMNGYILTSDGVKFLSNGGSFSRVSNRLLRQGFIQSITKYEERPHQVFLLDRLGYAMLSHDKVYMRRRSSIYVRKRLFDLIFK